MASPLLQCTSCKAWLTDNVFNRPGLVPCPTCSVPLQVEVFPAFFRSLNVGREGERVMMEGEASCFYHSEKKAVVPCAGCGRFLCALCDCELHGEHYCPPCVESGRRKGRIKSLENERTLHDQIALALAIYPIITIYFTILTAPMAIYTAVRHWKSPLSVVRRSRWRFVVAIILSLLQISAWVVLGFLIVDGIRR